MTNRFGKIQWAILALLGLLLCFCLDRYTTLTLWQNEPDFVKQGARFLTNFALGDIWFPIVILLIVFLAWARRSPRFAKTRARVQNLWNWSLHFLLALITTGLATLLIKSLVGRRRPKLLGSDLDDIFKIHPLTFVRTGYLSFPSGHTQVIFCVGVMLGFLWPKKRGTFLVVAFLLASTRLLVMRHFLSDVYAGALIGAVGTYLSVQLWSRWVPRPRALR